MDKEPTGQTTLPLEIQLRRLSGIRIIQMSNQKTGDLLPVLVLFGRDFKDYNSFTREAAHFKQDFYSQHGASQDGLTLEDRWVQDLQDFHHNYSDLQPRTSHATARSNLMELVDPNQLKGLLLGQVLMADKSPNAESLHLVSKAIRKAEASHNGQMRKDGSSYVLHPLRVALRLYQDGFMDHITLATALLHDVLEDDPNTTLDQLTEEFGSDVARGVMVLTKSTPDGQVKKDGYYQRVSDASEILRTIKVYDRIDNLASLSLIGDEAEKTKYIKETEDNFYKLATFNPSLTSKLVLAIDKAKKG